MTTPQDAPFKRAQREADWKASHGQLLEPTLEHRLRRLSAFERHEVRAIIRSMILRKTIRRVLSEAHTQAQLRDWRASLMRNRIEAAVVPPTGRNVTSYDPKIVQGYDHKARLILPGEEYGT